MPNSIDVVVLAAGMSTRMGIQNKLLLPFNGSTIIEKTIRQLSESKVDQIIAVLGHENEKVKKVISPHSVETIINPDYKSGQVSSVKAGIKALASSEKPVMIALGDMPVISSDEYLLLIDYFHLHNQTNPSIVRPQSLNGVMGNPVIFDSSFKKALLANDDMNSSKKVIQSNKDSLHLFKTNKTSFFIDVDDPKAYEKLMALK